MNRGPREEVSNGRSNGGGRGLSATQPVKLKEEQGTCGIVYGRKLGNVNERGHEPRDGLRRTEWTRRSRETSLQLRSISEETGQVTFGGVGDVNYKIREGTK